MLDASDHAMLRQQLGRVPRGVVAVAARCPAGHPCVFTSYPLRRRGEVLVPFPTLYWLSCPALRAKVAHLERDGAIAELSAEVERNAALREELRRNHADCIARRWAMLTPEDQRLIADRGLLPQFQSRGIGGMTNFAAVKCLHLHLAHHLAAGNALGAIMMERYDLTLCA